LACQFTGLNDTFPLHRLCTIGW